MRPVAARAISLALGAHTLPSVYYRRLGNELPTSAESCGLLPTRPSVKSCCAPWQVSVGPPALTSASDDNKSEPRMEILILG